MNDSAHTWHERAMGIALDQRSLDLRREIVGILGCARRGHLGASMSLVEILRVLYDDILRFDPARPGWSGRDRCILSKGHGCLALYVILADKGFFSREHLDRFCASGALLGGHPDATKIPGVEATTGSLGHGPSIGVGMAVNALHDRNGARIFVVLGDGECNEGSVWEAAMCAGKRGLDNMCVLVDYNKHQSWGPTREIQELEPFLDKWRSFGFAATEVNGHDPAALRGVLAGLPLERGRPSAVICHTVKGKGVAFAENNLAWHHKSGIKDNDLAALLAALEQPCARPA